MPTDDPAAALAALKERLAPIDALLATNDEQAARVLAVELFNDALALAVQYQEEWRRAEIAGSKRVATREERIAQLEGELAESRDLVDETARDHATVHAENRQLRDQLAAVNGSACNQRRIAGEVPCGECTQCLREQRAAMTREGAESIERLVNAARVLRDQTFNKGPEFSGCGALSDALDAPEFRRIP